MSLLCSDGQRHMRLVCREYTRHTAPSTTDHYARAFSSYCVWSGSVHLPMMKEVFEGWIAVANTLLPLG
jgi:hypothetical protein